MSPEVPISEVELFLGPFSPLASEEAIWGEQMRLHLAVYLSHESPPLPYITSVRAVVLRDGAVLVQEDRGSRHILPGGRRERDESLEATLRREVAEETGWSLGPLTPLGFTHLLHLDSKQPGYAYPHPHFFHRVYVSEALAYAPEDKVDDGYEMGSEFVPITDIDHHSLTPIERVYLVAALRTLQGM